MKLITGSQLALQLTDRPMTRQAIVKHRERGMPGCKATPEQAERVGCRPGVWLYELAECKRWYAENVDTGIGAPGGPQPFSGRPKKNAATPGTDFQRSSGFLEVPASADDQTLRLVRLREEVALMRVKRQRMEQALVDVGEVEQALSAFMDTIERELAEVPDRLAERVAHHLPTGVADAALGAFTDCTGLASRSLRADLERRLSEFQPTARGGSATKSSRAHKAPR